MGFSKKGYRKHLLESKKIAESDIKNMGKYMNWMGEIFEPVMTVIVNNLPDVIPVKEEIGQMINITCRELNIPLPKRHRIILENRMIKEINLYLKNPVTSNTVENE